MTKKKFYTKPLSSKEADLISQFLEKNAVKKIEVLPENLYNSFETRTRSYQNYKFLHQSNILQFQQKNGIINYKNGNLLDDGSLNTLSNYHLLEENKFIGKTLKNGSIVTRVSYFTSMHGRNITRYLAGGKYYSLSQLKKALLPETCIVPVSSSPVVDTRDYPNLFHSLFKKFVKSRVL